MPEVPAGVYVVVAGTDRDNNDFICEEEDACGIYPDLVTVISGRGTTAIDFTVANFVTSPASLQEALAELPGDDFRRIAPAPETGGTLRLRRLR
jgi:serine protease